MNQMEESLPRFYGSRFHFFALMTRIYVRSLKNDKHSAQSSVSSIKFALNSCYSVQFAFSEPTTYSKMVIWILKALELSRLVESYAREPRSSPGTSKGETNLLCKKHCSVQWNDPSSGISSQRTRKCERRRNWN